MKKSTIHSPTFPLRKIGAVEKQVGLPSSEWPTTSFQRWFLSFFLVLAVWIVTTSLTAQSTQETVSPTPTTQVLTNPPPPLYATSTTNPAPTTNAPTKGSKPQPSPPVAEIPPNLRPFLIKGGVGFVVGLAIGVALRAIAKLVLFLLGLVFLAVLIMAYLGWVQIQWSHMLQDLQVVADAFRKEFSSFREFLNGTLPAVVLTGLGVALGMRFGRRR